MHAQALPGRDREQADLPEARAGEAAGVAADRGAEVPVRPRGRGARAGRRRAPAVGGLARQRRLEPAPGAALGPRPPRRAARRHRPDAEGAVGPRAARRAAGRRGAARARARRLPAHVGLARDARDGPHPPAVGLPDRARGRARAGARGRAPQRGDGDVDVVDEGAPAGRRVRRLQPERQGPHGRRRLLDPPGAGRARGLPRRWDEVPDCELGDFRIDTVPERLRTVGDPSATIDETAGSLDSLLELAGDE